jgi:hypothetical protein
MKSAFISLCAPKKQHFLKTGINEYSSTCSLTLFKVEALEMAEIALTNLSLANKESGNKHEREEKGEVPLSGLDQTQDPLVCPLSQMRILSFSSRIIGSHVTDKPIILARGSFSFSS